MNRSFAPHSNEYMTGRLLNKYPTLPLKEAGRAFRFRPKSTSSSIERAIANLEYGSRRKTIVTTYELGWREKMFVLIDGELWRINSFSREPFGTGAASMLKTFRSQYTIELMRVDNPAEVSM